MITTERQTRSIAGTCFSDGKPRFIQIKGINLDAEVGQHMLYTTNDDVPGIIGLLGTVFGETASTSRTSSSAATGRAAMRSRCSISTAPCRTRRCSTA